MRKCPRCQQDVKDTDKYCPHCGLDLQRQYRPIQRKPKNRMIGLMFNLILCMSLFIIPLLYTHFLGQMNQELIYNRNEGSLPGIRDTQPTSVLYTFDTLSDYQNQFDNVLCFLKQIILLISLM